MRTQKNITDPDTKEAKDAIKQLQKDLKIVTYPERINSTNESDVLVTIDNVPALTVKQFNTYINEYWNGPFASPEKEEYGVGVKQEGLERWITLKAFEMWSKKNNIQLAAEDQKKLNEIKDAQKEGLLGLAFAKTFKLQFGFDDTWRANRQSDIKKIQQNLGVKENTEYLKQLKKYFASVIVPLYDNYYKKLEYREDTTAFAAFQQQQKDAIREFFHPKK